MWEIILALVGLALGLGLGFLKIIPKIFLGVISIVATVVVAVMLWNFLGLPAVDLLNKLTSMSPILGLALGYIVGERVGNLI